MIDYRIGHGYDVHRFDDKRELILGGVRIPHNRGLLGHSDADVLIHALMDAILGAMALGDIGMHFPDTSVEFKGISSLELLKRVCVMMHNGGWCIANIDATVIAQAPKLLPHIPAMKDNIASILGCEPGAVNVKATTEEGLGFTGLEQGIASHAVVLLQRNKG